MNACIFVTGTDTGVGKTVVTAALVAALRARGIDAWPMKPVQTGAPRAATPDLDAALRRCGMRPSDAHRELLCPYRFAFPSSVHLAAARAGKRITVAALLRAIRAVAATHARAVVEGAGGILVPLNARETMLDVIRALAAPVVVVARPGLGTLNHTMLTVDRLRAERIEVRGIALSAPTGAWGAIERDNAATLARRLRLPVVRVPRLRVSDVAGHRAAGERMLTAFRLE